MRGLFLIFTIGLLIAGGFAFSSVMDRAYALKAAKKDAREDRKIVRQTKEPALISPSTNQKIKQKDSNGAPPAKGAR